jgi:hypothetical protein
MSTYLVAWAVLPDDFGLEEGYTKKGMKVKNHNLNFFIYFFIILILVKSFRQKSSSRERINKICFRYRNKINRFFSE